MYDTIIIGAGASGIAAALYCAKNSLRTLVVAKSLSNLDWADEFLLQPANLKTKFESALQTQKDLIDFYPKQEVITLEKNVVSFSVELKTGQVKYGKTIIIATGGGNTDFDLLTHKDSSAKIKTDAQMRTNIAGIFACGGCTVSSSGDVFVSSAQGAQAALSATKFLQTSRQNSPGLTNSAVLL